MTSWTTPSTQTTNTLITQTMYNNHIINNLLHLYVVHGARAYRSTTQSISDNTWTPVGLDTEAAGNDTDSFHSTSVNNSRFTIPTGLDGRYDAKTLVHFAANATGIRGLRIIVDAVTVYGEIYENNPDATSDTYLHLSVDIPLLNAGQYIQAQVYQNSGSPLNLNNTGITSPHVTVRWTGNE